MSVLDKKGINVTGGFKLISPQPIDARYIVEDEVELQSIVDNGATYEGLEVWVTAWSKKVVYNGSAWVDQLAQKVDVVDGKGLSTNDFTEEYKTKLDNFEENVADALEEISSEDIQAMFETN